MKKARIMLTSIAVLAVVGGALAFKAKNQGNVYCKISSTTCRLTDFTTQGDGEISTQPCVTTTAYYLDNQCLGQVFDGTQAPVFTTAQ